MPVTMAPCFRHSAHTHTHTEPGLLWMVWSFDLCTVEFIATQNKTLSLRLWYMDLDNQCGSDSLNCWNNVPLLLLLLCQCWQSKWNHIVRLPHDCWTSSLNSNEWMDECVCIVFGPLCFFSRFHCGGIWSICVVLYSECVCVCVHVRFERKSICILIKRR